MLRRRAAILLAVASVAALLLLPPRAPPRTAARTSADWSSDCAGCASRCGPDRHRRCRSRTSPVLRLCSHPAPLPIAPPAAAARLHAVPQRQWHRLAAIRLRLQWLHWLRSARRLCPRRCCRMGEAAPTAADETSTMPTMIRTTWRAQIAPDGTNEKGSSRSLLPMAMRWQKKKSRRDSQADACQCKVSGRDDSITHMNECIK